MSLTTPVDCPDCDGIGEHVIRNSHWGSPSCAWDYDTRPCGSCGGRGFVDLETAESLREVSA